MASLGATVVVPLMFLLGCTGRDLRGTSNTSPDGGTYLIIADDNGGKCGPLLVDGVPWPMPLDSAGAITPGVHSLACGTELEIRVDSGQTFRFDYWGP